MRRYTLTIGILLLTFTVCFGSFANAEFKKTKIAVLDFELQGNKMKTDNMGAIVAEWFTTTMVQAGRFDVIERAMLQKILEEQKLAMMGIVDETSASKLGKVLGVENIITGSLLNLGDRVEVNARIIDVESGSIVAAENVTCSKASELQKAVRKLTKRIVYHFPMTGYIVQKEGNRVTIDMGIAAGLHVGMEFVVFKEGKVIKHPKTGEILDVEQIRTGRIVITSVRNNVAEADIISEQGEGIRYGHMVQSVNNQLNPRAGGSQVSAPAALNQPDITKIYTRQPVSQASSVQKSIPARVIQKNTPAQQEKAPQPHLPIRPPQRITVIQTNGQLLVDLGEGVLNPGEVLDICSSYQNTSDSWLATLQVVQVFPRKTHVKLIHGTIKSSLKGYLCKRTPATNTREQKRNTTNTPTLTPQW